MKHSIRWIIRTSVMGAVMTAMMITGAQATSYKTTAAVYLRESPSINADTIKVVKSGAKVQRIKKSEDGNWLKVSYGSKEGYIYKKFLNKLTTPTIEVDDSAEESTSGTLNTYFPSYDVASESVNGTNLGQFKLTFYCGCTICSEGYGTQTATGGTCVEGRTIAVDPTVIPYGTKIHIDGFGDFVAEDCGGAIKGNHIDIYVADHDRANSLGVQYANVTIVG